MALPLRAPRSRNPVDTVFGQITFDAKGDAQGMKCEINVWHSGYFGKLP